MDDLVTSTALILTPEIVLALIELLGSLLERSSTTKSDFRDNLTAVKIDLGMVNDVLKVIQRKKRRNLSEGVRTWKDEASLIVEEAQELLTRIDNNNSQRTNNFSIFRNTTKELRYSNKDARQLESLKKRLGDITKHNQTVIALLRASRCFPL